MDQRIEREAVDLVVVNARELVTLGELGPGPQRGRISEVATIEDGAVAIADGRIVDVGRTPEVFMRLPRGANPHVVDARGCAVVPGFIDPHSHLIYAGSRAGEYELRLAGASYPEIVRRGGGVRHTISATRAAEFSGLVELLVERLRRALCNGLTTVEVKTGYWQTLEGEILGLRAIGTAAKMQPVEVVPTFLGALSIPDEFAGTPDRYVDVVVEEMIPRTNGLAVFCDVFCDEGFYSISQTRRILSAAKQHGLKVKLHADEFADMGTAALAAEMGATSADHLCNTSEAGMRALAGKPTIGVLLPGTRYYRLAPRYADARKLMEMGIPVALGTDHGPSSPVVSPSFVIGLACADLGLSPAEALVAMTWNAAHAIGVGDKVGRLVPGFQADLLILAMESYRYLPCFVDRPVPRTVLKKGRRFPGGAAGYSAEVAAG